MNRARVHSEAIRERLTEAPDSLRAVAFSGRTLSEYERFFDIGIEEYEERRLLDCASGSASFAAEAMRRNVSVVGVDPLYGRQAGALGETARWDLEAVLKGVTEHPERFELGRIGGIEGLRSLRQAALKLFEEDYPAGRASGRYCCGSLPDLPFPNNAFDLVLCGHFLFLYADRLDYGFHFAGCRELCRVSCREVRIYPLLDLEGKPYPLLARLMRDLSYRGIESEIVEVEYEVLRGSTHTLILRRKLSD